MLNIRKALRQRKSDKRYSEANKAVCKAFGHITIINGTMYDKSGKPNACLCK